MRTFGVILSLLLAAGLYAGSSVPVFSADNGTVTATVTVQDVPCITVGTTTITYGTKPFSTSQGLSTATSSIGNVDSCSTAAQSLSATGSTATATGATWNPVATLNCSGASTNQYRHTVRDTLAPKDVQLSLSPQALTSLTPNQQDLSIPTTLNMPCTGSDGAGRTMNMSVTLTVTVP
jgi:hypothetical protein